MRESRLLDLEMLPLPVVLQLLRGQYAVPHRGDLAAHYEALCSCDGSDPHQAVLASSNAAVGVSSQARPF